MVVLAAVDDTEVSRFAVEQLTWRHCGWLKVIEMLTPFIQRTHHRTANVSGHSLWRIALGIRNAGDTQELLFVILRAFSGEESSRRVFLDAEDCHQKHNISSRDERHRSATMVCFWLLCYWDLHNNRQTVWRRRCADHQQVRSAVKSTIPQRSRVISVRRFITNTMCSTQ